MNRVYVVFAGAALFGLFGPLIVWAVKLFLWGAPTEGFLQSTPLLKHPWVSDLFLHYVFYGAPAFLTGAVSTYATTMRKLDSFLSKRSRRLAVAAVLGVLVWLFALPLFGFGADPFSLEVVLFTALTGAIVSALSWLAFDRLLWRARRT